MWSFKKSKKALPVLVFKSGEDFVSYHCKYMTTRLTPGSPLAALVMDAREHFGTKQAVSTNARGIQTATLRVASDDGGFVVIAETSGLGEPLEPGDAVAWIPAEHMPELARVSGDERSGWIGLIVAKVAPEIDVNKAEMRILCRY